MSGRFPQRFGDDVTVEDVDLDEEVVIVGGERMTNERAQRIADEFVSHRARGGGRCPAMARTPRSSSSGCPQRCVRQWPSGLARKVCRFRYWLGGRFRHTLTRRILGSNSTSWRRTSESTPRLSFLPC